MDDTLYGGTPLSAYRHLATLGRDQYVRVERPIYLFPFGHRGTMITITERKIKLDTADPAAYLYQRTYIVLRERTRRYDTSEAPTNLPFVAVLDRSGGLPRPRRAEPVAHRSVRPTRRWHIVRLEDHWA